MTEPDLFKTCPDCAEQVRGAANICRFCGYSFLGGPRVAVVSARDTAVPTTPVPVTEAGQDVPSPDFTPTDVSAYFDPAIQIDPALVGPQEDPSAPEPPVAEMIAIERRRLESISPAPKTSVSPTTIALMALAVVLMAGFCIFALATTNPPPPRPATPSPIYISNPTLDPQEASARYVAFADVASSEYSQIGGLVDQLGSGTDPAALVIALETSRDTLSSIEPATCFAALYNNLVNLSAGTLKDAQAYVVASSAGTDPSADASKLVEDMKSWNSLVNTDLPHNICTH
jgi:hypothetical protein